MFSRSWGARGEGARTRRVVLIVRVVGAAGKPMSLAEPASEMTAAMCQFEGAAVMAVRRTNHLRQASRHLPQRADGKRRDAPAGLLNFA